MSATIISESGNELTLQVKIDLSGSVLEAEEKIVLACNEVGMLSTEQLLTRFDADGLPIMVGNHKYTLKEKDKKGYQTPYGEVDIKRCVYQESSGGKVYIPLENGAKILHGATPKFAKILSHKYGSMSAQDVLNDLSMNHGRKVSKKYIQRVSESVSYIAQTKSDSWAYEIPEFEESSKVVTVSMDGAMLPTCREGWRESMVGTISIYNPQGERQHSIYIGESPEYGKNSFRERLGKEIYSNGLKILY